MKVKCPHCGAIGRVPADKVPAKGANIRCTACRTVFRIGGPEMENVVQSAVESTQIPAMNSTQTLPSMTEAKARALSKARRSASASTTPAERTPEPRPSPDASSGPADIAGDLEAAMAAAAGSVDAPPPASSASASDASPDAPALLDVGLEALEPAKPAGPKKWKVKSESGIVYDFQSTGALRKWLKGRSSHDGMLFSDDGGTSYRSASEVTEISDIQASLARSAVVTGSMRAVGTDARTTTHSGLHRVTTNSGAFRLSDVEGGQSGGAAPLVVEDEKPFTGSTPNARPSASRAKPARVKTAEISRSEKRRTAKEEKAREKDKARKQKERDKRKNAKPSSRGRQTSESTWKYVAALVFVGVLAVFYYSIQAVENTGVPIPDSPAGEQLQWFVDLMQGDSSDTEALTDIQLREKLSEQTIAAVEDAISVFRSEMIRWDSLHGSWTVVEIYEEEDLRLGVWVESEYKERGRILVEVEPAPPHRIISLEVLPPRTYIQ